MLELCRIRDLLNDPNISEADAETIRDVSRAMAEMMFSAWQNSLKRIPRRVKKVTKSNILPNPGKFTKVNI